jgi:hypothetical protein
MWILLWLALESGQTVEHYHIGNYADKDTCIAAMSKATVLVTNNNQSVDCLWVNVKKAIDK